MKRTLITGGAGFIGSHLAKRLIKEGNIVTVIDNLERGKLEFLEEIKDEVNFHFEPCDLTNYDKVKDLFVDKDEVIHLASKVGGINSYLSKPYQVMSVNTQIDINVLKCVIENKISTYFYASSAHVYPRELQKSVDSPMIKESDAYPSNPELTYGWAKLTGEKMIKAALAENPWMKVAIARFVGIYGPNQDFNLDSGSVIPVLSHRAIKYGEIPFKIRGTGKETRSYCFIDDALDCVEEMISATKLKNCVGPYNVGRTERCTIEEIANQIVQISNKDINIEWGTESETAIWGQWCDCSLAKEELGWEAKTSLRHGLEIVYNDIKKRI